MDAFDVLESVHAGYQRGSCGADVVNEQNMFTFQRAVVAQLKDVCYVLLAFMTTELRLTLDKMFATQGFGDNGKMGNVANSDG